MFERTRECRSLYIYHQLEIGTILQFSAAEGDRGGDTEANKEIENYPLGPNGCVIYPTC